MDNLTVVVGGQAGSEGKGAICGRLCADRDYDFAVRVGGPNAGHTIVDGKGQRFPLRQIPVAAVASPDCELVIGAGSEIDLEVLIAEIHMLEEGGYEVRERLLIDGEATLLTPDHVKVETSIKTGTTGKGIGGARAARVLRQAARVKDMAGFDFHSLDTQALLREQLRFGDRVMLEGTQGYWLGSHAGYYPHCTSGDCTATDMMSMAGLAPSSAEVWVVLRTHPIRIAGNSGPLEEETSWEELGLEPEITTVTKKVRRVGGWNQEWARESVQANYGEEAPKVALTFADYWWPGLFGVDGEAWSDALEESMRAKIDTVEDQIGGQVRMLGTGPSTQIYIGGQS